MKFTNTLAALAAMFYMSGCDPYEAEEVASPSPPITTAVTTKPPQTPRTNLNPVMPQEQGPGRAADSVTPEDDDKPTVSAGAASVGPDEFGGAEIASGPPRDDEPIIMEERIGDDP